MCGQAGASFPDSGQRRYGRRGEDRTYILEQKVSSAIAVQGAHPVDSAGRNVNYSCVYNDVRARQQGIGSHLSSL